MHKVLPNLPNVRAPMHLLEDLPMFVCTLAESCRTRLPIHAIQPRA